MVLAHKMQAASKSTMPACSQFALRQDNDIWKPGSRDSRHHGNAAPQGARVSGLHSKSFSLCQLLALDHSGKLINHTHLNIN